MKQKIIIVLTSFYIIQFLASCCGDAGTFEISYTGFTGSARIEKEGGFQEFSEDIRVNKLDFVISISLQTNEKQIASKTTQFSNIAFQRSHATSCPDPKFIYLDAVTSLQINAQDSSGASFDATSLFMGKNEKGELVSVQNFLNQRQDWQETFELYMRDTHNNIGDRSEFTVLVATSSNKTFNYKTKQILFN